jgi:hypothetical protein
MVDLDNIRSLQDYSGMVYTGAVLEWANQTGRDPTHLRPADVDDHLCWAYENDIRLTVCSQTDFERVLSWIHDPEWDNSEAHDLFVQVQNSEYY